MQSELLAEIRISPSDIGHIKMGFPAKVKVTSFDFSRYGTIDGTVTGLSATTTFTEPRGKPITKASLPWPRTMSARLRGKHHPARNDREC